MAGAVKPPKVGAMLLRADGTLVTIDGKPETVAGGYVVPYAEVSCSLPPIGDDLPESEWSSLTPVREPLASAIRRAVGR